jgi:probable phosphoglycerate mutase
MALGPGAGAWWEDRFAGPDLDPETWFQHYLRAWSSRARSRASHLVTGDGLTLDIPVDHPGAPARRGPCGRVADVTALQCATTMVVARHGEAEYEAPTWAEEGGSLTLRGRQQAAALAESLAGRRVAHVWTSTLARAVQTGEIVAARLGVGVTTRIGLREFDVGDHRGVPLEEDPFAETYARWLQGQLDERIPGGETGLEIAGRFGEVLREIADLHPGETVLVVSHGGAIGLGVPAIARMDAQPQRLGNCDTVELLADADGWVCTRWGAADPGGES